MVPRGQVSNWWYLLALSAPVSTRSTGGPEFQTERMPELIPGALALVVGVARELPGGDDREEVGRRGRQFVDGFDHRVAL